MDAYELTRMVYTRVQAMEPEVASKVMGYLLLQDLGEQEMLKLAFGPDTQLQAVIANAKQQLGLAAVGAVAVAGVGGLVAPPAATGVSGLFSSPSPLLLPPDPYPSFLPPEDASPHLHQQQHPHHHQHQQPHHDHHQHQHQNHHHPYHLSQFSPQFDSDPAVTAAAAASFFSRPTISTVRSRPSSLSDIPLSPDSSSGSAACLSPAGRKPCLYYARGYCKHGSNCRFLHTHGAVRSDPASPSFSNSSGSGLRDSRSDDGLMPPGSLERLEVELQELLRGRRAPVSIASLPQLYYERFGRTLQAEGYLTESQRHGKAGYSLTKLLARLKNTVTLIDRPHGQHAVVLAEDALRFTAYRGEKDDYSGVNPGSRQIYLTFPAESTFLEEDVSKHFGAYGPVHDVRIPFQQKRMFGFVTFVYPDTVRAILAKGNPHYICGARVLVKPYKEKGKHSEKKMLEREHSRFLIPSRSFDGREYPFPPGIQFFDDHDLLRRQINEQALELERRRFAEMQLADSPRLYVETKLESSPYGFPSSGGISSSSTCTGEPADDSRTPEDLTPLQASNAFGYLLDVLDDPAEDEKPKEKPVAVKEEAGTTNEHNLPDSPFASPHAESQIEAAFSESSDTAFTAAPTGIMRQSFLAPDSPPHVPSYEDRELTCPICRGFFVDPVPLDCNHIFCIQCILKVIRVSKDECPVCHRHIGSQIVKLLENRGFPLIEPSLTNPRGAAAAGQITSW